MTGRYEAIGPEAEFEPGSRGRVLRNRLGITSVRALQRKESEALLAATQRVIDEVAVDHRFTAADVCRMHRLWLGEIYEWAGCSKWTTIYCNWLSTVPISRRESDRMITLCTTLSALLALALLKGRSLGRDVRRLGTTIDSRSDDDEAGHAQGWIVDRNARCPVHRGRWRFRVLLSSQIQPRSAAQRFSHPCERARSVTAGHRTIFPAACHGSGIFASCARRKQAPDRRTESRTRTAR